MQTETSSSYNIVRTALDGRLERTIQLLRDRGIKNIHTDDVIIRTPEEYVLINEYRQRAVTDMLSDAEKVLRGGGVAHKAKGSVIGMIARALMK